MKLLTLAVLLVIGFFHQTFAAQISCQSDYQKTLTKMYQPRDVVEALNFASLVLRYERMKTVQFVDLSSDDCDWGPIESFARKYRQELELPLWNEERDGEDPLQCAVAKVAVELWEANRLCESEKVKGWPKVKKLISHGLTQKVATDEQLRKLIYRE